MLYDLVLAFLVLVLFVCNLSNEVVLFCVCVVCFLFVTRLSGFLGCILWSCFCFCCFVFKFCHFHSCQKRNKNGHSRNPTKTNMQKRHKKQLAQLCSQIVFLIIWGGLSWKQYKIVVSTYFDKGKNGQSFSKCWVKTWFKVESKLGPRMLRNIIGPSFDSNNGIISFFLGGGGISWKQVSFSLQKEEDLWKTKQEKMRKVGPSFWLRLKKAIFGFWELIPVPLFFAALFCRQKHNES